MPKISIPPNARRLIDTRTRKVRVVDTSLAPLHVVGQQRLGETLGRASAFGVVPLEMAWEALKGLGKAVHDSNVGTGFAYGFQDQRRSFAVRAMRNNTLKVHGSDEDIATMKQQLINAGLDENEVASYDAQATAQAVAEMSVENSWEDDETFVLYQPTPKTQERRTSNMPSYVPAS